MKKTLILLTLFLSLFAFSQNKQTYSFNFVQNVPAYPGCKGDNAELKKCTNRGVQLHIVQNMNSNVFSGEKLEKPVKSFILFTISETGKVSKVYVKSSQSKLKAELERVVKLLPDFKPGMIDKKAVAVKFTLPFTYRGRVN